MIYCGILVRSGQKVEKGQKDCQGNRAFNTTGKEENKKCSVKYSTLKNPVVFWYCYI